MLAGRRTLYFGPRRSPVRTPQQVLGSRLWYFWDWSRNVTIATGLSQLDAEVGGQPLVQATPGNQPAYTALFPRSYSEGDGSNDRVSASSLSDVGGGSAALFVVGDVVSHSGSGTKVIAGVEAAGASKRLCLEMSGGGNVRGVFGDSVGGEIVTGSAWSSGTRLRILENTVGVSRRLIIDGTAVSGARTLAISTGAVIASAHALAGGGNASVTRIRAMGIVVGVVTDAEWNAIGRWHKSRFGGAWTNL